MLFNVEYSAESLINLPMSMRPNSCLLKPQRRMHSCAQKPSAITAFKQLAKRQNSLLHGFLKDFRRPEGLVGLNLHNVKLQLLPKREAVKLHEVHNSSIKILNDFVNYR